MLISWLTCIPLYFGNSCHSITPTGTSRLEPMMTRQCDLDPSTSHFCILKLGFTGEYFNKAVLTCTVYVFSKNKKSITIFHLAIIVFSAMKHRRNATDNGRTTETLVSHMSLVLRKPVFGVSDQV